MFTLANRDEAEAVCKLFVRGMVCPDIVEFMTAAFSEDDRVQQRDVSGGAHFDSPGV
jgi:hypothetical protein